MKSKPYYYLIIVLVLILFCSFSDTNDRIIWNKDRPLEWTDFIGTPDYRDHYRDAVTASALKFTTRCYGDGKLEVYVAAEFVKNQSWVKNVARSDYHLGHERLHFDITELYARKFRQEIANRQLTCDDSEEIQALVYDYLQQCMDEQNRYDKETRSSLHKTNQALWEEDIQRKMIALENFAR